MERLLLKTSLSGTAMAKGARMTTQSGLTTDASPTAWNLVRHLPPGVARQSSNDLNMRGCGASRPICSAVLWLKCNSSAQLQCYTQR